MKLGGINDKRPISETKMIGKSNVPKIVAGFDEKMEIVARRNG
jgi:hypothetical protein